MTTSTPDGPTTEERRPHLGTLDPGTLERAGIAARDYRVVNDFLAVMQAMTLRLEETAVAFDLNGPTLIALRQLDEPMSQKSIAERLGCDPSYVTSVVDRLEHRGAVERVTDPDDRRVKRVVLTDEGRALRRETGVHLLSGVPALLGLTDDEIEQLASLLAKVVAANRDVLAEHGHG